MSLMNFFSGPTPEKLESRGDTLCASGHWGPARQCYERALAKLEKSTRPNPHHCRRLHQKIRQAREDLAREHRRTAMAYLEGGHSKEAREALLLAMDISEDVSFREAVAQQISAMDGPPASVREEPSVELPEPAAAVDGNDPEHDDPDHPAPSPEEYFQALCHTLPEDVARAYRHYGLEFRDGYIALNKGDFATAAGHLEEAMDVHPEPGSYIPLELATAYLNLGCLEKAHSLLEQVRRHHPEALPAYQLLCEIYWDQGESAKAEALLASLPPHLAESRAVMQLKGETLYRTGRHAEARDFCRGILDAYGWHEGTVQQLAKAHEALNELSDARRLYGDLMTRCRSCGSRAPLPITHKYAELSFAEGDRETDLLEIYLDLARQNPAEAALYFERISRIYFDRGDTAEGERFRAFARRARNETTFPDPEG